MKFIFPLALISDFLGFFGQETCKYVCETKHTTRAQTAQRGTAQKNATLQLTKRALFGGQWLIVHIFVCAYICILVFIF